MSEYVFVSPGEEEKEIVGKFTGVIVQQKPHWGVPLGLGFGGGENDRVSLGTGIYPGYITDVYIYPASAPVVSDPRIKLVLI